MSKIQLQARLKPFDGKRYKLQRLSLSQLDGMRFEQGFWYGVTDTQADYLKRIDQDGNVHESIEDVDVEAFDVCTHEDAVAMQQSETRHALLSTPEATSLVVPPTRDDPGDGPKPIAARRVGARAR